MTEDTAFQIVERAKRGDKEAFVSLYHAYYDLVYAYVYHRTYQRELAEDITSDVFCLMIQNSINYTKRLLKGRSKILPKRFSRILKLNTSSPT